MRSLVALLLGALVVLTVVTFVSPEWTVPGAGEDWFPREVGVGSERVDGLFDEITWIVAGLFGLVFAVLAWVVWRGAGRADHEGSGSHGHGGLELAWTLGPIAVLAFLTWSQVVARAEIAAATADSATEAPVLVVDVEGAQFDWRFGYAGQDGRLGTVDDVVEVVELTVPIGQTVELRMRSVDVLHSFFVPALRLKRDLVPGTVVPLRFRIDAADLEAAGSPETLELRCAELCGWGHYAMVGRVRPLAAEDFSKWLALRTEARFDADNAPGTPSDPFDESAEEDDE